MYFVACEALANVGKYARRTTASVRSRATATGRPIEIADDGVGGADAARGSGLHGLADRVEALTGICASPARPAPEPWSRAELPCGS